MLTSALSNSSTAMRKRNFDLFGLDLDTLNEQVEGVRLTFMTKDIEQIRKRFPTLRFHYSRFVCDPNYTVIVDVCDLCRVLIDDVVRLNRLLNYGKKEEIR